MSGGVFGGAGGVLGGNLLTSALGKVAGVMSEGFQAGKQYTSMLQTAALSFETLLGSADKAQAHLKELEQFALKSPFQFEDILQASARMQAFGFQARSRLSDLRALSDAASVAAGAGGNFKEALDGITLALGQMQAKGKVSAEEMNQLAERGIPAWDILAGKVGKTKAELMKLSEQGKLRGDVASEILIKGFQERYGGLSEKLAQTLAGKESNAQDALKKAASFAAKTTIGEYEKALDELLKGDSATLFKLAQGFNEKTSKAVIAASSTAQDAVTGKADPGNLLDSTINDPLGQLKNEWRDLKGLGKALYDGVLGAWQSLTGPASEKAAESGKAQGAALEDGLREALEMKSPSRVMMRLGDDAVKGLALGLMNSDAPGQAADEMVNRLIDRTSAGMKKWGKAIEAAGGEEFLKAVEAMAARLGQDPNKLMNIMAFESQLNPAKKNPRSTATGLIQFMRDTATGLGTTVEDLKKMGAIEQLDYVEKYFKKFSTLRQYASQEELYTAVLAGKPRSGESVLFKSGTRAYIANRELDKDKSGTITAIEAAAHVLKQGFLSSAEKIGPPLQQLVAPVVSIAQFLSTGKPALPALKSGSGFDPAAVIRGLDGPQAKPFSAAQQGGLIVDPVPVVTEITEKFLPDSIHNWDLLAKLIPQVDLSLAPLPLAFEQTGESAEDLFRRLTAAADGERWKKFGERFGDSIDQTLGDLITNPGDWKDTLRSFASNLANDFFTSMQEQILTQMTGKASIGDLIGSFIGGLFGGGKVAGARAAGGPVAGGKTYLVGEKGPELFKAEADGQIIPNHKLEGGKKKGFGDFVTDALFGPIKLHKPFADFYGAMFKRNAPDFIKSMDKRVGIGLLAAPLLATPLAPFVLGALPLLAFGGGKKGGGGIFNGGLLGGLFGGKREAGGPVSAGLTYLVGERGPELYQPSASAMAHAGGAVSNHTRVENKTVNVVNNFHIAAPQGQVSRQTQQQIAESVGAAIAHAARRNG
jgi:tape measure domain-containing protein